MAGYRGGRWPYAPGYHNHQLSPSAPMFQPSYFPSQQHSDTSVKVVNLSKDTKLTDIRDRLKEFSFSSMFIKDCPSAPVNYAYLNCIDSSTAQRVVDKINGKMLLHCNLLQAKLQSQAQTSRFQPRTFKPKKPKDICAVKVLLQDLHLKGEDLDQHFRQYGALRSNTVIRNNRSLTHFAFVNFEDPYDAQRARQVCSHVVKGKSVVAVEFRTHKRGPPIDPTADLTTLTLPCDPLVLDSTKKKVTSTLQRLDRFSVRCQSNALIVYVHVQEILLNGIKELIQEIITTQKSYLENIKVKLDHKYLSVLADEDVQKTIQKINVPFELRVSKEEGLVGLAVLGSDYSSAELGSSEHQAAIHPYLSSSDSTTNQYHWHWHNGISLQPYPDTVSDHIQEKHELENNFEIDIDQQTHIIDFTQMTDTNKSTGTIRQIERKLVESPKEVPSFQLNITAHKDHTPELKREILDLLSKMTRGE